MYFQAPRQGYNTNDCLTTHQVELNGGKVIENSDGTVSVYGWNNNIYYPIPLTQPCCLALNSNYTFDIDSQQCIWGSVPCDTNKPFKLVINPRGNDGVIFSNQGDGSCNLNIEFDYLFKFDCDNLYDKIAVTAAQSKDINKEFQNQQNAIEEQQLICSNLTAIITDKQRELIDMPYVIECAQEPVKIQDIRVSPPGLGGDFNINTETINYCLTDAGLNQWSEILTRQSRLEESNIRGYDSWLASDGILTSVYSCADVNELVALDDGTGKYLSVCNGSINDRHILKEEIAELEESLRICQSTLLELTNAQELREESTPNSCDSIINALETLDVSVTLDIVNNIGDLTTVYEAPLFNIGANNLYNYINLNSPNTGIIISGTSSTLPPYVLDESKVTDENKCLTVRDNLFRDLISEAERNISTSEDMEIAIRLFNNSFNSPWLNKNILISDPIVLLAIQNKKIKLSIKVKNHCVDFSVLLDNIKLNKECISNKINSITINRSPSFELERVRDNKKSWVTNADFENRTFDLSHRETEYNINSYKLAINSKEVDLNISSANAIETDVQCYIYNNPCLLDCITGVTEYSSSTFSCPSGYTINPNNDGCTKIENTGVTASITIYTATTTTPFTSYCKFGANFYENIDSKIFPIGDAGNFGPLADDNGTGTTLTVEANVVSPLWGDNTITSGRLNNAGIWATTTVPLNEFIGFSYCLDIPVGGVYTMGICGDNYVRIKVNGVQIVTVDQWESNFFYWHVFPLTFDSGLNIIELEGANANAIQAAFGAEIYSATTAQLSAMTTTSELSAVTIFSTLNQIGVSYDLGENSGYSCPIGYSLNLCDTNSGCTKITKTTATTATTVVSVIGCIQTTCGGDGIDFNDYTSKPLSGITTLGEFTNIVSTELIDVKNRKTLSAYPTIGLIYERYLEGFNLCETDSSKFDYENLDKFGGLIGNYWVDLIEQVIPSTTIWGSTYVYRNTIFDNQKFKYKSGTLITCNKPDSGTIYPSPVSGANESVEVTLLALVSSNNADIISNNLDTCNGVYISQLNCGSEFIGTVSIIGTNGVETNNISNEKGDYMVIHSR